MKRFFVFIFLILLFSVSVSSETIVEFQETDLVNLRPLASDTDGDALTYFFSTPLSTEGKWQTTYGDAGEYKTKVTVSDGRLTTTEEITLIITKKEEVPELTSFSPDEENVFILEGDSEFFEVNAQDLNNDPLSYTWWLDAEQVSEESSFTYTPDFYSEGTHLLEVWVSDGVNTIIHTWNVEVGDFDRSTLLDSLADMNVLETESVQFTLPDFERYDLTHTIEDPVNDDGFWQTTYDDAGEYEVRITIEDDKEFRASKNVDIIVENVDRSPTPKEHDPFWLAESQEVRIPLDYEDPDGDDVTIDVFDLPDGAFTEGTEIVWVPSYDVVTKDNALEDIARRYHVLNNLFVIRVKAQSNDRVTEEEIKVRVFNSNRHPVLDTLEPITVTEGEVVHVDLVANDPDNDSLSFSFEGFMTKNDFQTKVGDAGKYLVTIKASDGFLEAETLLELTVLPINSPPNFKAIPSKTVTEGERVEVFLDADDPDKDVVMFSVDSLPEGASLTGNRFIFAPTHSAVAGKRTEDFWFNFVAKDSFGNTAEQSLKVTVRNENKPPQLLTSSQQDGQTFNVGDSVTFEVDVVDLDGDDLTYKWRTSAFETVESGDKLTVEYTKKGKKAVSVVVSDGKSSIERSWELFVEKKKGVKLVQLKPAQVVQPTPQPEPTPQPQPEPKPEPKPVPIPQPKPIPVPQPVPIPQPIPQPQPQPEPTIDPWQGQGDSIQFDIRYLEEQRQAENIKFTYEWEEYVQR